MGRRGNNARLRRCSHGEASAAEFHVVERFVVGVGTALVGVGPARQEEEEPADDGESGDGGVAEGERPPLLPALTLPRRRSPRTPVP